VVEWFLYTDYFTNMSEQTSKPTAVEWAKVLYGPINTGKPEIKLTSEQVEQVRLDIERMEARFKAVGIDPDKELVTGAFSVQQKVEEPVKYTPEMDAATKAMVDILNNGVVGTKRPAHTFLEEASRAMKQRAELRDAEGGERTAAKIAEVFNAITGHNISEADAWMFLIVLKIVRSRNGKFNADDYVDLAAYAGLLGECESVNRE
jgi:hypothetical protein